jgi:hypothetical protein
MGGLMVGLKSLEAAVRSKWEVELVVDRDRTIFGRQIFL